MIPGGAPGDGQGWHLPPNGSLQQYISNTRAYGGGLPGGQRHPG